MGSFFEIQVITPCHRKIKLEAFVHVQKELDQMESEMSLYQSESPLSQLNRQGFLTGPIPPHLGIVLKSAIEAFSRTDHFFDISIWPVLSLIQDSFKSKKRPPSTDELEAQRPVLGTDQIQLSEKRIEFRKKGMGITLDGIAKGYAVDVVAKFLDSRGFKNYLLNFSGNMRWKGLGLGVNRQRRPWKIKVWNPLNMDTLKLSSPGKLPVKFTEKLADELTEKLTLEGAVASSGGENEFYDGKKQWHHIIDPLTLMPANIWIQTTVLGPRAQECDFLSTATFVMTGEQITKLIGMNFPEYLVVALDQNQGVRIFQSH